MRTELEGVRLVAELNATAHDYIQKERARGKILVGTWPYTPIEVLRAFGVLSLFYGPRWDIERRRFISGEDLRSYVREFSIGESACRDIQGSAGSPLLGVPPPYDLVVTDFPDKMESFKEMIRNLRGEYLELEIPRDLGRREAIELIELGISRLLEKLELLTGIRIDDEDLSSSIDFCNEIRRKFMELDRLLRADPYPIRNFEYFVFRITYGNGWLGGRFEEGLRALEILVEELERRVERGIGEYPEGAPRALYLGTFHKNLCRVFDELGIPMVAGWPTSDFNLSRKLVRGRDPIRALSRFYSQSYGLCSLREDVEEIEELFDYFEADFAVHTSRSLWGYRAVHENRRELVEELRERGYEVLLLDPRDVDDLRILREKLSGFLDELGVEIRAPEVS